MPRIKLTTDEFIERAVQKHGNKYDYSDTEYINAKTKVYIRCPEHGLFPQIPNNHTKLGQGCKQCMILNRKYKGKMSHDLFITRCHEGGLIDYELDDSVVFGGAHGFSELICLNCNHKVSYRSYKFMTNDAKCHVCGGGRVYRDYEWFDRARYNKPHIFDELDFTESVFKSVKGEWEVVCRLCNNKFNTTPKYVYQGYSCPICNESKGEKETAKWFRDHMINFKRQMKFNGLIGVSGFVQLPFDFYIPDLNTCIEYDGEQHYRWVKSWMTEQKFLNLQEHDRRKNEYCDKHGIRLIRIRWDEDVDEILSTHLHPLMLPH